MNTDTASSESDNPPSASSGASPEKAGGAGLQMIAGAVVGGIGAILSWKAVSLTGDVFVLPPDLAGLGFGSAPSPEDSARLQAATLKMNLGNAACWMAITGAVLGALWGLTICLSRRPGNSSIRMMLSATFASGVFGAFAGVAAIWIDTVARRNLAPGATNPAEHIALLMHGTTWLVLGLGVGLGVALGTRAGGSRAKTALVIALSGMVGGCLFPIAAAILFPAINSSVPIPYPDPGSARILWLSMPSILMGLAVGSSNSPIEQSIR